MEKNTLEQIRYEDAVKKEKKFHLVHHSEH